MSRYYKKTPAIQQKYGGKTNKWVDRQASKAVRRYKGHIPNGSAYKKIYCSWNISDYTFYQPWDDDAKKCYDSKREWAKYYCYKLRKRNL